MICKLSNAILAGLATLATSPVAAQTNEVPYYGHHHWGAPWHGWFIGPFMVMLFVAVVVVALVLLMRWLGGNDPASPWTHRAPPGRQPLDILKERFAKGEIDKAEFEERRRALEE